MEEVDQRHADRAPATHAGIPEAHCRVFHPLDEKHIVIPWNHDEFWRRQFLRRLRKNWILVQPGARLPKEYGGARLVQRYQFSQEVDLFLERIPELDSIAAKLAEESPKNNLVREMRWGVDCQGGKLLPIQFRKNGTAISLPEVSIAGKSACSFDPPDLQEEAVKTVLAQAELLCAEWV